MTRLRDPGTTGCSTVVDQPVDLYLVLNLVARGRGALLGAWVLVLDDPSWYHPSTPTLGTPLTATGYTHCRTADSG